MAFHYRNLQHDSIEDSITSFCAPYCEPERNQLGLCPSTCISFCYPTCQRPFLVTIPPPSDDKTTTITTTTTTFNDHVHNPNHDTYRSSHFVASALAVIVIAFLFFLFYSICKFCSAWCDSRNQESSELTLWNEQGSGNEFLDRDLDQPVDRVYHPIWYIRSVGLQPSVISSITIFKYKKGNGIVDGTMCAVCLNEFQEDETLRLLPKCNHAFHIPCIDTWLGSHTNCPICRADIVNNQVLSPSQAQNVDDPGALEIEETHERVLGNVENPRALEKIQEGDPGNENKLEMVNDSESCESTDEKSHVDSREELRNGDSNQSLSRSTSCDPLTESLVNESIDQSFRNIAGKGWIDGPDPIRRSLSCSANQVLSRHSKSRKSLFVP